ncbi:MAG: M16 family metallopeptidase [Planctomycetota bacterium]|jgi:predicted Zn-dependent peptidase
MRNKVQMLLGMALAGLAAVVAGCTGGLIPAHPEQISFPPLDYQVPPASQFREVLSNGMVVYITEDRMLPTFDMTVTIRAAAAFEPPEKAGLASLVGEQLRDGGTQSLTPEELDERVEFLAASVFSRVGDTRGSAGLSLLSKDIDEGLALLIEMLRYPRFDEERFRLATERRLQNVKRRNDSTGSIESIEWGFLMDGENHYSNRYPSSETIKAVTREDLVAFHNRYYHPGNMIVAVAGDFDRAEMLEKLERAFVDWPVADCAPDTFPEPEHAPVPGVYLIHKEDVNQGRVSIGHKGVLRGTPDEFALRVMDGILGAAGFKSRLVAKVRSDEGLAYSVGSRFGQGTYYPGDFRCYFQSKSNSCAYATQLVLDEIARLQNEQVSRQEVDDVVSYYVESFPQRFGSKMALLRTYASDEYTGRDPGYWQTYIDNLKRVAPDDVQRVARQNLHAESLVILAVGDADAIESGGHDKARDLRLEAFGAPRRLPLRDPDTLRR